VAAGENRLVGVGLVGCGRVAQTFHLPALGSTPSAEVLAVADTAPDTLRRVADRFHIKQRFTDHRALLEVPNIEAVGICVPAQFHVNVALAALDAGKHLLIEKPLALSMDESRRLMQKAGESGCKIMVGFNLRWHRLVRDARQVIQRGTLGPLRFIRTVLTSYHENVPEWRKRRRTGGGVLFEQAVHHIDLLRFLLQSEVAEVSAVNQSRQWDDEAANVTARMADGVLVTAAFSERTTDRNEVEIYGEAGCLRLSCFQFDGLELCLKNQPPGGARAQLRKFSHTLKELPRGLKNLLQGGDFVGSYRAEWRHFIDAIRHGTNVECTLEDGWRALEVVLAAIDSSVVGRPVMVTHGFTQIATPVQISHAESV